MGNRRYRESLAACAVLVWALTCAACAAESSPPEGASATVAESESSARADAVRAAEGTVRAFFAVRSEAEDDLSAKIDAQESYLTAREVHPSAAYEADMRGRPIGITETDVRVELSDPRWVGEDIQVDFEFTATSVNYPLEDTELQLDEGTPGESYWNGTATLENRDGEWLIDDLTVAAAGGGVE